MGQRRRSTGELVRELVAQRGLTSCMNDTKWREFQQAMATEMPFPPPYIYRSLFEEGKEDAWTLPEEVGYTGDYSAESFAWNDYQTIQWVKVRPWYYQNRGGLLCQHRVLHNGEEEFLAILKRYSIPYEEKDGVYTIYGYR